MEQFIKGYGTVEESWVNPSFSKGPQNYSYVCVRRLGDVHYSIICSAKVIDNDTNIEIEYYHLEGIHPNERPEFKAFMLRCIAEKFKVF